MIEFGDFPEPVDYDLARERAERSWLERGRERERGRGLGMEMGMDMGRGQEREESFRGERVEGLGIREVRR